MRKLMALGVAAFIVLGCASSDTILKNYDEQVDLTDGISMAEAKLIAKEKIINTPEKRYYRITAPAILNNLAAQAYPEYWFVAFGHNWFSPVSTQAEKTYTELKEGQYLVVIDKSSGDVKFYGEYYSKRANNFDWVFDQDKRDPLAPSPGMQSQDLN